MEATDKSVLHPPNLIGEHAPKYPAVLVNDEQKETCMLSSSPAIQNAHPFDYSVYSNPEFDGLPVLGPYRYMQESVWSRDSVVFTYKGQYKDGLRHGSGRLLYPDGSVYEGYFYNDWPHFKGRLLYRNGNSYCGDWKDGKMGGHGTSCKSNGDWYTGTFKQNACTGHGKELTFGGD